MERAVTEKRLEMVSSREKVNPAMAFVAMVDGGVRLEQVEPMKGRGLCSQADPTIFFPERGGSAGEAKKICAQCSIREQCLEEALAQSNYNDHGIWGGTTERERRKIRKTRSLHAQSEHVD
jgi:WhiB family redox-sensing transcriptional regulator